MLTASKNPVLHLEQQLQHCKTCWYECRRDPSPAFADEVYGPDPVEHIDHEDNQDSGDDVEGDEAAPVPVRILQKISDTSSPNSTSPKRWVSLHLLGRSKKQLYIYPTLADDVKSASSTCVTCIRRTTSTRKYVQ